MNENRDYADLERTDIAVYNFRGYTVLRFWKKDAEDGMAKALEFGKNANHCSFIPDDFHLMSKFLEDCYAFCKGELKDIEHVSVS